MDPGRQREPADLVATERPSTRSVTVQGRFPIGIDDYRITARPTKATAHTWPDGGRRARRQGQPTTRDAAGPAMALIPPLSGRTHRVSRWSDLVRSKGITTVQDAWASEDAMNVYDALAGRRRAQVARARDARLGGSWTAARVSAGACSRAHASPAAADPRRRREDLLRRRDPSARTQTAVMIHPYLDSNGQRDDQRRRPLLRAVGAERLRRAPGRGRLPVHAPIGDFRRMRCRHWPMRAPGTTRPTTGTDLISRSRRSGRLRALQRSSACRPTCSVGQHARPQLLDPELQVFIRRTAWWRQART